MSIVRRKTRPWQCLGRDVHGKADEMKHKRRYYEMKCYQEDPLT